MFGQISTYCYSDPFRSVPEFGMLELWIVESSVFFYDKFQFKDGKKISFENSDKSCKFQGIVLFMKAKQDIEQQGHDLLPHICVTHPLDAFHCQPSFILRQCHCV
jgi:hypothetical protein